MSSSCETPEPDFGHLMAMTDERGTFEHALFAQPRPEHGYCSDDMARVLVVAAREPDQVPEMRSLAMLSLRFLQDALDSQGRCRNRMNRFGAWEDSPGRRRLLGKDDLGSRYGRLAERRPPDPKSGRSRTRASDDAAFSLAQGHGVRGARSSRGTAARS